MSAKIIDGKAIAEALREEVKQGVAERAAKGLPVPGVGNGDHRGQPCLEGVCPHEAQGLPGSRHSFCGA